jgi:type IV secretion system protein VirB8
MLIPLKTVQPYVLTVDKQTGAVEAATTVASGRLTQNEAVIQAQLANYVRVRETFDASDLAENYRRVQLMSSPDVRNAYVAQMAATNPTSPLRALSPGDTVAVRIKSVSLTGSGSALVRYDLDRTVAGGRGVSSAPYVSAISFGFSGKPLRAADRFENPLGFQVTRYRRDAEGMTQ